MKVLSWIIEGRLITYGQRAERENDWRRKVKRSFYEKYKNHKPETVIATVVEISITHYYINYDKMLDLDNIAKSVMDTLFFSKRSDKIQQIFSTQEDRVVSKLLINRIFSKTEFVKISISFV